MNKNETIDCLKTLKEKCALTTLDGKAATIIMDCNLDSFIWVINNAISYLENDRPDYKDC